MSEIEAQLMNIFTTPGGSTCDKSFKTSMLTDFRKLEVIYTCLAGKNETLCTRYKPGANGCAYYLGNGQCGHTVEC